MPPEQNTEKIQKINKIRQYLLDLAAAEILDCQRFFDPKIAFQISPNIHSSSTLSKSNEFDKRVIFRRFYQENIKERVRRKLQDEKFIKFIPTKTF